MAQRSTRPPQTCAGVPNTTLSSTCRSQARWMTATTTTTTEAPVRSLAVLRPGASCGRASQVRTKVAMPLLLLKRRQQTCHEAVAVEFLTRGAEPLSGGGYCHCCWADGQLFAS